MLTLLLPIIFYSKWISKDQMADIAIGEVFQVAMR